MTFRTTSSGETLHRVPDARPEKVAGVKALCGCSPPFWSRPLDPEQGGPICPDCEAAVEFEAIAVGYDVTLRVSTTQIRVADVLDSPPTLAAVEFEALLAEGQAMSAEMRQRTADMRRFTPEEMAVRVRTARETP